MLLEDNRAAIVHNALDRRTLQQATALDTQNVPLHSNTQRRDERIADPTILLQAQRSRKFLRDIHAKRETPLGEQCARTDGSCAHDSPSVRAP